MNVSLNCTSELDCGETEIEETAGGGLDSTEVHHGLAVALLRIWIPYGLGMALIPILMIRSIRLQRKHLLGFPYKSASFFGKLQEDFRLRNTNYVTQSNGDFTYKDNLNIFLQVLILFLIVTSMLSYIAVMNPKHRMMWFGTAFGVSFLHNLAVVLRKRRKGLSSALLGDNHFIQVEAANIFQDFETPTMSVAIMGIVQLILAALYIGMGTGVQDGSERNTPINYTIYYYLAAFISVGYFVCHNISRDSVKLFTFWQLTMHAAKRSHGKSFYSHNDGRSIEVSGLHIWIRFLFDLSINYCATHIILMVMPLQVATNSGSPVEFVLNVLAAFYIIALDDLKQNRSYRSIMITRLQQKKITDFFSPVSDGQMHNDPEADEGTEHGNGCSQIAIYDDENSSPQEELPICTSHSATPSGQEMLDKKKSKGQITYLTNYGGKVTDVNNSRIARLRFCLDVRREAQKRNMRLSKTNGRFKVTLCCRCPFCTDVEAPTNGGNVKHLSRLPKPDECVEKKEKHKQAGEIVAELPKCADVGDIMWLTQSSSNSIKKSPCEDDAQLRVPKLWTNIVPKEASSKRIETHHSHEFEIT